MFRGCEGIQYFLNNQEVVFHPFFQEHCPFNKACSLFVCHIPWVHPSPSNSHHYWMIRCLVVGIPIKPSFATVTRWTIYLYIYICIVCGFLLFSCTAKAKKHQEIVDWQAGEELMITVRDAQQNIPIRIHGRNICLHFPLNVAIFPLM